jgi:predicted homoserine dehydrogenase-like protein
MSGSRPARKPARIGLVGTGPMATSFARMVARHRTDMVISSVLTRRQPFDAIGFPLDGVLTDSLDQMVERADVVVECTGDVAHGTAASERALNAGLPVVTMNAELHVTTGTHLAGLGRFTEAEGDQPGSIAALQEDAVAMGFKPLVYGNMKGFRNPNPTPHDMAYWAERQGISIPNTTGATDGTKVQIEQVLVANGYGATITQQGLDGPASESLAEAAVALARRAEDIGIAIADYVLAVKWAPTGVFLVCRHDDDMAGLLNYFKLGPGPYYLLVKPYHLCSLEIAKTVRRMVDGGEVLLNNGIRPTLSVGAVAKRALVRGQKIERGSGGFDFRGEALKIAESPRHVPVGVIRDAVMTRDVEPGQLITFDDIDIPDSHCLQLARRQLELAMQPQVPAPAPQA